MKKPFIAVAGSAFLAGAALLFLTAASPPSGTFGTLSQRTSLPGAQTLTAFGPTSGPTANGIGVSADQTGYGGSVSCVYTQVSHTGSSAVVFSIEGKFGSSYVNLISSASIAATDGSTLLSVGAGVTTTANVGLGVSLPATWRTKITETGGGSTVTGRVDCSLAN